MTEYTEDKPIKADCGHYVTDHNELVEVDGRRVCPECAEYGEGEA
jgi:formylmethanofuran dehydrogenase subunit E